MAQDHALGFAHGTAGKEHHGFLVITVLGYPQQRRESPPRRDRNHSPPEDDLCLQRRK